MFNLHTFVTFRLREFAFYVDPPRYQINFSRYCGNNNSYLYSKAAKSYFDEPREKLSSRPLCGRDKTISRLSKDFVAKVYTTFCVQPENL
jgi:hypothetical protein